MVHALRDAWRALRPEGTLLDLRPVAGTAPIRLSAGGRSWPVGELHAAAAAGDDAAADASIDGVVAEGLFARRGVWRFQIEFGWNTAADLAEYAASGRHPKRVRPSFEELDVMCRSASQPARLVCPRELALGAWRRISPGRPIR